MNQSTKPFLIAGNALALAFGTALTLAAAPAAAETDHGAAAGKENATALRSRARTIARAAPAPRVQDPQGRLPGRCLEDGAQRQLRKDSSPTSPTGFGQLKPFTERRADARPAVSVWRPRRVPSGADGPHRLAQKGRQVARRARGDEMVIHHLPIDVRRPRGLDLRRHRGDAGHLHALQHTGGRQNLRAVADGRHRLFSSKKCAAMESAAGCSRSVAGALPPGSTSRS